MSLRESRVRYVASANMWRRTGKPMVSVSVGRVQRHICVC
jgi:hypothetical protein